MQALARRYEQRSKELAPFTLDPQVMALPHPLRILASADTSPEFFITGVVGMAHAAFTQEKLQGGLSNKNLWVALEARCAEQFLDFMQRSSADPDAKSGGSAGAMFQAMRYQQGQGAMFTIDEPLLHLLSLTDIELDIPITEVRLPFANIYLEFGKDRLNMPAELALMNPLTGAHAFEGAYVSQTKDANGDAQLEVTMTGSPVGHRDVSDDAIEWVSMRQREGLSITKALAKAFASGVPMQGATPAQVMAHHMTAPERFTQQAPRMALRLELIIKVLLFIGMKEARKALIGERTKAQAVLNRSQSGAHRRRALRDMLRARQSILVMAPLAPANAEGISALAGEDRKPNGGAGPGLASHWRRGHFRDQRHGPGMALSHVIWIAPQMINAQSLQALAKIKASGFSRVRAPVPRAYTAKA